MAYPYASDGKLGVSFTGKFTPSTTFYPYAPDLPNFPVGTLVTATDGSVWLRVVLSTGGCTGAGYVCTFNVSFVAVMMTSSVGALGDKVGVAANADAAVSGDYIWLQVYGKCQAIRVAASAVANVALASTATAGTIDDSVAGGTKNLPGIFITTTDSGSGGNAPGELNWPTVGTTN